MVRGRTWGEDTAAVMGHEALRQEELSRLQPPGVGARVPMQIHPESKSNNFADFSKTSFLKSRCTLVEKLIHLNLNLNG